MSDQKGSLKDRLRSWNIFLRYRLNVAKKKQQEKNRKKAIKREEQKRVQMVASGKYYSKPKIFGITLVGLFFGIFESKIDKHAKIEQLESEINDLDQNINKINSDKEFRDLEKRIVIIKSKNRFNDSIIQRLNACGIKLENIKRKQVPTNKRERELGQMDKNALSAVYTPVLEIKVMNKELKGYNKKLKEINAKIKATTAYNSLYELEFEIKQLKIKINDLLNKYHNLKELPGFDNLQNVLDISEIDLLELRFNANSINAQIKMCNESLDDIEQRRKQLLEPKIKTKGAPEKDKKKEKHEKKKNEEKKQESKNDDKLLEVKLAQKIVLDRLIIEQKNIERFQKNLVKMTVKKRRKSILSYAGGILSSIINFGLSLFPISLFKNKLIGGLVSGIMVNNSLKSIRKVLTPETDTVYILFSDFEKELYKTEDYLNSMGYICSDSLNQINEIRSTLDHQYGNDIEYSDLISKYLRDLDQVEAQILAEQEMIMNMQEQITETKVSNKQKIKDLYN
ncbi:MAG: hypothetical protein E7173_01025 [Firmicutes bacterium]|nr:hypothetical protein [Bacillota bacterium]